MSREHSLWVTMRESRLPGHWTRVENRVERGTPDVNFCVDGVEGWMELKDVPRWPTKPGVPLRVEHFTKQQRFWLRRRAKAGGRCFVFIRVQRPVKTYLLLDGAFAADHLGEWTQDMLLGEANLVMRSFKRDLFLEAITCADPTLQFTEE